MGPAVEHVGVSGEPVTGASMARSGGIDLGPGEDNYAALRAVSPTMEQRASAPRGKVGDFVWPAALLTGGAKTRIWTSSGCRGGRSIPWSGS